MFAEQKRSGCARAALMVASMVVCASAQTTADAHQEASAGPLHNEAAARIFVGPPLLHYPRERAVEVGFQTENLRIAPVFGPAALSLSPRVGHLHASVDDLPWVWAHTSEEPVIVSGLPAGQHKLRLKLMTANHQPLDEGKVDFTVPEAPGDATVGPLSNPQPRPRLIVETPVPEPLARGVVFIRYRAENLDIVPVFGEAAAAVSPRLGHLHVSVDEEKWYWVEASRNPIIVQGLQPGRHIILIKLANPNHQVMDQQRVEVTIPAQPSRDLK